MDIHFYLQGFEASMRNFAGDDPLDAWDKFVDFLQCRLPAEEKNNMSVVLDRLIQTFLQDKRYHDDIRYINHCISCASYHPDPIKVYSFVHSHGIGTRAAVLYVSWAHQLEKINQPAQVELVYERALENHAEPLETLQQQYRLFQNRTKSQVAASDTMRNPLQNSQLVNQQPRQRDAIQPQCKEMDNASLPSDKTIRIISRSENNPRQAGTSVIETLSMYCVEELLCENSELSFEELRARRYFTRLKQQEFQRQQNEALRRCEAEEEEVLKMRKLLEELNSKLTDESPQKNTETHLQLATALSCVPGSEELSKAADVLGSSVTVSLLQPSPTITVASDVLSVAQTEPLTHPVCVDEPLNPPTLSPLPIQPPNHKVENMLTSRQVAHFEGGAQDNEMLNCEPSAQGETGDETNANVSHGGFNHSHITPNTSLGLISATPSRVLPSPTVHTREALDLISHMFQVPTLLHDTLFNSSTNPAQDDSFERSTRLTELSPTSVKPPPSTPFMIYQDENPVDKCVEHQEQVKDKIAASHVLMERPVSKANYTSLGAESLTDDSAVWGPRHASMAACPNHTSDFALSAHVVSTPLHPAAPYAWDSQLSQENVPLGCGVTENNPFQRQPAKLSPILEQSPLEDKDEGAECTLRAQGTIVGECVSLQGHTYNQTNSTIGRQSLAPLSFPDHSTAPIEELSTSYRPNWSIHQSPSKAECNPELKNGDQSNLMLCNLEKKPKLGLQVQLKLNSNTELSRLQTYSDHLNSSKNLHSNSISSRSSQEQLNSSTRPGWSIYGSPVRLNTSKTVRTESMQDQIEEHDQEDLEGCHISLNADLDSRRLSVFKGIKANVVNSNTLQCISDDESNTRPSWSIYQSPKAEEYMKVQMSSDLNLSVMKGNPNEAVNPNNFKGLISSTHSSLREINTNHLNSSSLQSKLNKELESNKLLSMDFESGSLNSSKLLAFEQQNSLKMDIDSNLKPTWSVYQSPENPLSTGEMRADPNILSSLQGCSNELNSSRFNLLGTIKPQQISAYTEFNSCNLLKTELNNSCIVQSVGEKTEEADILLPKRSFCQRKSLHQLSIVHQGLNQDVPMSPQPAPKLGWLHVESPVRFAEPDLDVMVQSPICKSVSGPKWNLVTEPLPEKQKSFAFQTSEKSTHIHSPSSVSNPIQDIPMSPEPTPRLGWVHSDILTCRREPDLAVMMMSPHSRNTSNILNVSQKLECVDVPMSPVQPPAPHAISSVLISDPWDGDLISSLLSGLHTPLSSYPNFKVRSCRLPSITPKLTVQIEEDFLRVDFILGQGAFATVYQATNLNTSEKHILKVQKPSNPWEFYIDVQLNTRIQPEARHLYNQLYSAHLFSTGSILIGEPHTCGTLLNVVNLYKSRSEKLMPQPLVLYFAICILNIVERLHSARIIHADIKPDNFLLGERFLQNENFDEQNLQHGLVLIDFGQSIDMSLFPDGTTFTARCMTSGFQCTEMLSGRPWTYQTDYYGIAGTVHCMLFGNYMQVRNEGGVWKTNGVFKRNPHSDLWQKFFYILLNVRDTSSLPCLRSLCESLSTALRDNYSTKLRSLKNRLVVQILESRSSRR